MVASGVLVLRRPDLLVNAQFWAEDGTLWFQWVYNVGFVTALSPMGGYIQLFPHLAMGLASLFPLEHAPLVANLIGVAMRALLVVFLFSSRFKWIDIRARFVLAAYLLLMPNIAEVHANIANTHWYLSLYLLLVLLADDAQVFLWQAHDLLFAVLAGLSDPVVVFLAPGLVMKFLASEPSRANPGILRRNVSALSVVFCVVLVLQVATYLSAEPQGRLDSPYGLGASIPTLCSILASRIFLGFMLLPSGVTFVWDHALLSMIVTVLGFSILGRVFIKEDWRARSIIIFAALMVGTALAHALIRLDGPQWPALREAGAGARYFVAANVCWLAVLLYACKSVRPATRNMAATAAAVVMLYLSVHSFRLPSLVDLSFRQRAHEFSRLPPGTAMKIPVNPVGWHMTLVRK